MIAKLLNKLRYCGLTLVGIRVGEWDYARQHGVSVNILDFYVEIARQRNGEVRICWGHNWFYGNMWYKTLKKAG